VGCIIDTSGKPLDEVVENAGGSTFGEPQTMRRIFRLYDCLGGDQSVWRQQDRLFFLVNLCGIG